MERLTEKVFGYTQLKACGNDFCKETCEQYDSEKSCDNCPIQKAIEKLAEYEELEEQGLLLRLPCKVGDTVYVIYSPNKLVLPYTYKTVRIENLLKIVEYLEKGLFGKTVFLTHEVAEAALQKMNEGEY